MIVLGTVFGADGWPTLPPLAHNAYELATWAIIGLTAVAAAVIVYLFRHGIPIRRDVREIKNSTNVIKDEVKNTHQSNMRTDMDKTHEEAAGAKAVGETVLARVEDVLVRVTDLANVQKQHGAQLGGLRTDLSADREQTRREIARLDEDLGDLQKLVKGER